MHRAIATLDDLSAAFYAHEFLLTGHGSDGMKETAPLCLSCATRHRNLIEDSLTDGNGDSGWFPVASAADVRDIVCDDDSAVCGHCGTSLLAGR